jgi:DNA-binding MarR family transcriptional regulator
MSSREEERPWHFLTNHAQVLLAIADDPDTRLRDVAQIVGITERAAQRIVADLVDTSYVVRRGRLAVRIGERWSVRDLNPRPPACKAGALPAELTPRSRSL